MDEPLAYLNGQFLPFSQLALSPTDAGFVLGATVAEQLRTFSGKLFRLDEHLERLERSLDVVGVKVGLNRDEMANVAERLVAENHALLAPGDDLGLTIFVTPGIYAAYAAEPGPATPNLCLHTYPLPFRLWADAYRSGQALRTTGIEQVSPRAWPAELKCRSRMHYYLADREASRAEPGSKALLLDTQGRVTEASTANLVIYTDSEGLVSPPQSQVLEGISLAELWHVASQLGIRSGRRELTLDQVAAADEVLLTSTPLCLVPVVRINGQAVGDGTPGQVFGRLLAAWSEQVGLDVADQARRFSQRPATTRPTN
jgi:branched-chain amino acid aminotransferase